MKKQRLLKNNKGISLIELLVAIAILAILIVPILQNFMLSTRLNSKAKLRQTTTIATDSILEGIKAVGLEKFADEVYEGNYSFVDASKSPAFSVVGADDYINTIVGEMPKKEFIETEDGFYNFKINNYRIGGITYDADVNITGLEAYKDIQVSAPDPTKDVVIIQGSKYDKEAQKTLGVSFANIARTLVIQIEKLATPDDNGNNYNYTFLYTYKDKNSTAETTETLTLKAKEIGALMYYYDVKEAFASFDIQVINTDDLPIRISLYEKNDNIGTKLSNLQVLESQTQSQEGKSACTIVAGENVIGTRKYGYMNGTNYVDVGNGDNIQINSNALSDEKYFIYEIELELYKAGATMDAANRLRTVKGTINR